MPCHTLEEMLRLLNFAVLLRPHLSSNTTVKFSILHRFSSAAGKSYAGRNDDDDEWNDAWETAWLPDDLSGKNTRAPWESDVNLGVSTGAGGEVSLPTNTDAETKAFVAEMNENWEQRRKGFLGKERQNREEEQSKKGEDDGLYKLGNLKRDYRLKKQRVHAGLWMKEIEKLEETKLGGGGSGDDIEKLLDSCSEIFDSVNNDLNNPKVPGTSEFKNKPDGWESTSKSEDGSVWDMSQKEEDILLQEFERRMAFCKFQIASFIKTHIFSRRRPIDGWKYMIEVIGPNAKKGKGSVSRIPSLADPATQPFTEERTPLSRDRLASPKRR